MTINPTLLQPGDVLISSTGARTPLTAEHLRFPGQLCQIFDIVAVERGGVRVQGELSHLLYKDGDKDRPTSICDDNGQVVLGLCRVCGRGESELSQPCTPKQEAPAADDICFSLSPGDMVTFPHWRKGEVPVEIIDVNYAIRGVAVRLAPNGGIVCWPIAGAKKVTDTQTTPTSPAADEAAVEALTLVRLGPDHDGHHALAGITEKQARAILAAIRAGKVPNVFDSTVVCPGCSDHFKASAYDKVCKDNDTEIDALRAEVERLKERVSFVNLANPSASDYADMKADLLRANLRAGELEAKLAEAVECNESAHERIVELQNQRDAAIKERDTYRHIADGRGQQLDEVAARAERAELLPENTRKVLVSDPKEQTAFDCSDIHLVVKSVKNERERLRALLRKVYDRWEPTSFTDGLLCEQVDAALGGK